ncbi:MAG: histidine phosphatase family protein [Chloroflexota bacterium]
MTTLWLVRHGETDWNVQRRFQGTSDQPLNTNGEAQASSLAPRLAEMTFDAIYASDLIRVQRTAELALSQRSGMTIRNDRRLRELFFGTWEGMTIEDIRETFPDEYALWSEDGEQNVHGGERTSDAVARLNAFIADIRDQYDKGDQILIFAHGGTLAILTCILLGTDPDQWWKYRFKNCSLSELIIVSRGTVLSRLNDMAHFDSLA